jgi:hypothetical protein
MVGDTTEDNWAQARRLFDQAGKQPKCSAKTRLSYDNPIDCQFVRVKQGRRGRHTMSTALINTLVDITRASKPGHSLNRGCSPPQLTSPPVLRLNAWFVRIKHACRSKKPSELFLRASNQ